MLQFSVTQFSTILLFFITSKHFSKDLFAQFNWLTSVYITFGAVLSFGIEQLLIKLIAEEKSLRVLKIYLFHLTIVITIFVTGFVSYYLINATYNILYLLFLVWMIMNLFNVALKNTLIGFELFSNLSRALILANLFKILLITLFALSPIKNINLILVILIISLSLESIFMYYYIHKNTNWKESVLNFKLDYFKLLKEAFPQFIIIVFSIALARFDWIYLGLFHTADKMANYTFAYKMFEFTKLPLLVISPFLLPLFSRIFSKTETIKLYTENIKQIYTVELFLSGLIPIIFACYWSPVLNFVFDNKYGNSNYIIFCVLILAVPLQYVSDYYWNLTFAQNKYKLSAWISIITTLTNIFFVIIFTYFFSSIGTAIAYTISSFLPVILYHINQSKSLFKIELKKLGLIYLFIILSLLFIYLFKNNIYITSTIPLIYIVILIKIKFINISKLKSLFAK